MGFQIQNELPTVELRLKEVLEILLKEEIKIYASGRTDRGVHAYGQVINFYTSKNIPKSRFIYALNKMLPLDIRVNKLDYVKKDFHARFSAKKKEYIYKIKYKNYTAFDPDYSYNHEYINLFKLNKVLSRLKGCHDFKGMCSKDIHPLKDTVKTIYKAKAYKKGDYIIISFIGSGFLKYQIRKMMSLVIDICDGKNNIDLIDLIFEKKDPLIYTKILTGSGLYLAKVFY
jgi:tRNA pseudouridine38-40 synthase